MAEHLPEEAVTQDSSPTRVSLRPRGARVLASHSRPMPTMPRARLASGLCSRLISLLNTRIRLPLPGPGVLGTAAVERVSVGDAARRDGDGWRGSNCLTGPPAYWSEAPDGQHLRLFSQSLDAIKSGSSAPMRGLRLKQSSSRDT